MPLRTFAGLRGQPFFACAYLALRERELAFSVALCRAQFDVVLTFYLFWVFSLLGGWLGEQRLHRSRASAVNVAVGKCHASSTAVVRAPSGSPDSTGGHLFLFASSRCTHPLGWVRTALNANAGFVESAPR